MRFAVFAFALCLSAQQAPLSFDVASVKPTPQPFLEIAPQRTGGRVRWTTDLQYMIAYAHIEVVPTEN